MLISSWYIIHFQVVFKIHERMILFPDGEFEGDGEFQACVHCKVRPKAALTQFQSTCSKASLNALQSNCEDCPEAAPKLFQARPGVLSKVAQRPSKKKGLESCRKVLDGRGN